MSRLHDSVVEIASQGLREFDEPVTLASGEKSRYFIDGKAAFARGKDLRLACQLLIEQVTANGITFDAVGGLTMGADAFAHGVAMLRPELQWFSVRKEPKKRGTKKRIEGADLGPSYRVLLLDDVVTTGGSIQDAFFAITESGAVVVAAATLVDRDKLASEFFATRGIPYFPLVTCDDLGIPMVSQERLVPA